MMEILPVTPSNPLSKALTGNSTSVTPTRFYDARATEPTDDGVYVAGLGGAVAGNRVMVMPFSDGIVGSRFWMRLWGWRVVQGLVSEQLWVPQLLVEMLCVTGNFPGPLSPQKGQKSPRVLQEYEKLCSAMLVTNGSLGRSGEIRVNGISPAAAWVELVGAQKFQFEFQRHEFDNLSMNAFFCRA